ncbi:aminoglycoside phosphotransferase family protein [Actinopolymorpha sp. B9G3]|uniref:aminoglycoside phosphotransferase family protein n=1 Tax=Actinopolymorpha sp. B9G3 TaxID=3158970 RepID=UPI0032D99FEF
MWSAETAVPACSPPSSLASTAATFRGTPRAGPLRDVLTAFARAKDVRRLPSPRAWCGGAHWPNLVRHTLAPRLPRECRAVAEAVVDAVLQAEASADTVHLVHGDFGPHNVLWHADQVVGVLDLDHACAGDPAIDAASLISFFGAAQVAPIVDRAILERAMIHRASLTIQLAAAAELLADTGLRDHALTNFVTRHQAGTLHDPGGWQPHLDRM